MKVGRELKIGLVEEARKQYKGEYTDKTQWNEITVRNDSFVVERGRVMKEKINMEEIKFSLAYEKKAHKSQCGLCRMYFEKKSVNFKIPNHQIMKKQTEWNMPCDGRRYESASFLYSSSNLCKFCAHFFDEYSVDGIKVCASGNPAENSANNLSLFLPLTVLR